VNIDLFCGRDIGQFHLLVIRKPNLSQPTVSYFFIPFEASFLMLAINTF
jgi:hypothetical protein